MCMVSRIVVCHVRAVNMALLGNRQHLDVMLDMGCCHGNRLSERNRGREEQAQSSYQRCQPTTDHVSGVGVIL